MLVWLAWLLATCGFGILLGGVASMQQVGRAWAVQGVQASCLSARQPAAGQPGGQLLQLPPQ